MGNKAWGEKTVLPLGGEHFFKMLFYLRALKSPFSYKKKVGTFQRNLLFLSSVNLYYPLG